MKNNPVDHAKEMALLADLAQLLKKHGRETFASLATSLADPEFTKELSEILGAVAESGPRRPRSSRTAGGKRPDRLARMIQRLEESNSSPEVALRPIVRALSQGEPPTLKDIKSFAQGHDIKTPTAKTRRDAIAQLIDAIIALPSGEVEALAKDLRSLVNAGDRSLEGWNRIIERSRSEIIE